MSLPGPWLVEQHFLGNSQPSSQSLGDEAGVPFDLALFGSAFSLADRIRPAPQLATEWHRTRESQVSSARMRPVAQQARRQRVTAWHPEERAEATRPSTICCPSCPPARSTSVAPDEPHTAKASARRVPGNSSLKSGLGMWDEGTETYQARGER